MTPEKKVAFIPGANRGLELQTACELGRRWFVVLVGSPDPEARKAAESLRCDVTKPEDRRAVPGSLRREMRQTGHSAQQRGHFYGKRRFLCDRGPESLKHSFIREPGRNLRGEFLRSAVGQSPD
jgi:NAD(P)-dependent dehydrogenase (short-subunit alcohol dehydrogenase family)